MTNPGSGKPFHALRKELDKCIRCGECRTVCPVFAVQRQEKFTPRGKIALAIAANDTGLERDDAFRETFSNCLLCLACVERCAQGSATDKLVLEARAASAAEHGTPAAQKLVYAGLKSGDTALRAAAAMQKLLFRKIPDSSGMHRRFPLPLVGRGQMVPELADTPFRQAHENRFKAKEGAGQVMFFTGCMANYAYTGIAESTVRVLNALDVEVLVPDSQTCCGAPMLLNGDTKAWKKLARKNLDALRPDSDVPVVVPCSTCGMTLKKHYPQHLTGNDADQAAALSARTMDISEYLVKVIGIDAIAERISHPLDTDITYHDPCHLSRGQSVRREPRLLAALAAGRPLAEMDRPDRCCGMAGTYSLVQRDTSLAIRKAKTDDIEKTRADLVATGCPGCIFQLASGLHESGSAARALHVVEALARAMGV
jgi:glycolate oxidase iron-sulfur subunit